MVHCRTGIRNRKLARLGGRRARELLGVKAVIAQSRLNAFIAAISVGMGVLPCQFKEGNERGHAGTRRHRNV